MNTSQIAKQAIDKLATLPTNVIATTIKVGGIEARAERGNSVTYSKLPRVTFKLNGRVISRAKLEKQT